MSIASKLMTLQDYLEYDDGTDKRYELVDGVLSEMPPESNLNNQIASFLFATLLQIGVPYHQLRMKVQVAVSGGRATAREPDFLVLSEDSAAALEGSTQCLITHDMPPPLLVVEVVSPRQESRDYRYKRAEYAARQIPEYWIVDPTNQKVTVLNWVDGLYEEVVMKGAQRIASPQLSTLKTTAAEILAAGR